jgi:hypothetical protein
MRNMAIYGLKIRYVRSSSIAKVGGINPNFKSSKIGKRTDALNKNIYIPTCAT